MLSTKQLAKSLKKGLLASQLCAKATETEPKVAKPSFAVQRRGKMMLNEKKAQAPRLHARPGRPEATGADPCALIHPQVSPTSR